MVTIEFKKLHPNASMPRKAHFNDAAFDIAIPIPGVIEAKSVAAIPTGFALQIPKGYFGSIVSRSGLSLAHSIIVLTGTIDADYNGEISLVLYNLSDIDYYYPSCSKLAQLLILPVPTIDLTPVVDFTFDLPFDSRRASGFGSTQGF